MHNKRLRFFGQDYDISSLCKGKRGDAIARAQWKRIISGEIQSRSATDELLLRGVDDSLRPQLWKIFATYGMEPVPEYDLSLRSKVAPRDRETIDMDVPRTFAASVGNDAAGEKLEEVRRILEVFSVADNELTYTQGMNAVVSILVLYMDEASAFQAFFGMMNNPAIYLKSLYVSGFPGLFELGRAFACLIERRYRWMATKIPDGSDGWVAIIARCFLSMMVALHVPLELKLVMYDRVTVAGKRALLSFQLALIRIFSDALQAADDARECLMQIDTQVAVSDYNLVIDAWNKEWVSEDEFLELTSQ